MIKQSVNETEWSSLLARTLTLILYISIWKFDFGPETLPGLSRNGPQGPVVRTPVSANPELNFNPDFFFFLSKALSRIIFSFLFRASSHQIMGKEFAFWAFISEFKSRTNPGWDIFSGGSRHSDQIRGGGGGGGHPDPEIRGEGARSPKKFYSALRASVWSKNKGRSGGEPLP